jgi:hypothetical protein
VNEAGWRQWREAEAAIGRGAALETAAAKLPPRQAAILRALDALDRGDRASIKAAAKATQDLDIGAVLDLVQADSDRIEPTAVRAALKRAGLANTPLPKLDLLRFYAAALARDYASVPPALTKASRQRLVLAATMMGLDRGYTWDHLGSDLSERSKRLAKMWAAAAGLARGHVGPLHGIVARVDPALAGKESNLDPTRWPAGERLRRKAPVGFDDLDSNTLERWLEAPLETRWDMGCQSEVETARQGPRDERRRLLGRLLVAIERVLREGRPHEAGPAVEAAIELVDRLAGLPAGDVLRFQLMQLLTRLFWWSSDPPPERLAAALWTLPVPFTLEERRHLAATLLAKIEPHSMDAEAVAEMLILHYQDPYQLDVPALRQLERHASSITPGQLQQGLREVAPWHRNLVLAAHAGAKGLEVDAFERALDAWLAPGAEVTPQLDRVRVATATHVVRSALDELLRSKSRARQESERLATAVTRWFAALEARALQVDIRSLAQGVALAAGLRRLARPGLEPARVAALVRERLATPTTPSDELTLDRARLALAIGDEAAAESGFRAVGRFLREAPKARAIELALRWCAGLQRAEEAGRDRILARWSKALDAWILQQPKSLLSSTALALAKAESELAEPLFDWALETIDDRDWTATWQALEGVMLQSFDFEGPDLGPEFEDMLAGDSDFQDALAKLQEMALGGLPPRPTPRRSGEGPGHRGPERGGKRG